MPSQSFLPFSRRSFLQLSAAASAAAAFQIVTEPMLAAAGRKAAPKDGIMIDSNENPLGPSQSARDAISAIIPLGGRYLFDLTDDLGHTFAQLEGLNPDSVHIFPGSSPALTFTIVAFTSPQRSYVTGDPGYEAGMFAAESAEARVVKVPLTKTYAHDVKAMIGAAPDAGLFYICNPNNPTGTLTPHSDIEYLVENKPKGSIVMWMKPISIFAMHLLRSSSSRRARTWWCCAPSRKLTAWPGCAADLPSPVRICSRKS